ncbi:MAG: PAS domain-containing protein, partial [Bacillota bacterium]
MFNHDALIDSEIKDMIIKENLLDSLPDPLFILDQEGEILDCFVGRPWDLIIPKDRLIGQNLCDFLSEEKIKEAMEIIDHITNKENKKKYYKFNFTVVRNDEKHYYETRLVPYLDDKILAVVRNISGLKKTEQELKKQKELYQKIFNLAPVGILIGDRDANIIDVNQNLAEINKVAPEDLIGTNVLESLVSDKNLEISKNNLKKIFNGETITSEIKDQDQQGNDIFIHIIETAINLEDDKQGYISLQTDITERKKREAVLEFNKYLIQNAAIAILRISPEG